jgi:hypothetical protein
MSGGDKALATPYPEVEVLGCPAPDGLAYASVDGLPERRFLCRVSQRVMELLHRSGALDDQPVEFVRAKPVVAPPFPKTPQCPACGYPDCLNGAHYKGIYDPAANCPHCGKGGAA